MDDKVSLRKTTVDDLAMQDQDFLRLQKEYIEKRQQFFDCAWMLPEEYRYFLLDYVNLIADLCLRKLILACEHMQFPEET